MSRLIKKMVSIVLIISMIFTSAGMSTFAESIDPEKISLSEASENTFGDGITNEEPEAEEEGSTDPEDEEDEESSESSVENTTESSDESTTEETTESSEESTTEETTESSEESTTESTTESSEESTTVTTGSLGEENGKVENEEKTGSKITATDSDIENDLGTNEDVSTATKSDLDDDDKVATDSEAIENDKIATSSEAIENETIATESIIIATVSIIAEKANFPDKIKSTDENTFGSLIDIPDNKKADLAGNWWLNFGLIGIPKEEIKKIEFGKGIRINNRDWEILKTIDDGSGGTNYRLLSKQNIGATVWSWTGDGCRGYYAYPPYDEARTGYHHDGAAPHKFLMNEFYPTFSDYYKNNMVLMTETETYWSKGHDWEWPTMKPLSTYIRIPVADEVDWFGDFTKLANGSNWWIMEHVSKYYSDGTIGREGAAVFPADGNYDPRHGGDKFTNYYLYREWAGVRAVMTMKKDGLKLDPNEYNYAFPSGICGDITNSSGDLMGFAYVINEGDGFRLYIQMLYDDAIKVTNAYNLFSGFTNVEEIKGLDLIDFSECHNMSGMFRDCSALKTISYYDSSLTKLPDNFGSSNSNINSMFKGCKNLENLDFLPDGFSPYLTIMESAFEGTKISTFPSQIDTSHVTNMKRLFAESSAETFDFNGAMGKFIAPNIDVSEMFKDSENLHTITVDSNLAGLPANVTKSTDMFFGCINLVGGEGFRYKETVCDGTFARVDYGGVAPGYLACTDENIYNDIEITIESNWKTNATRAAAKRIIFTVENDYLIDTDNSFEMPIKINGDDASGRGWTMNNGETIVIHVSDKIGGFKTSADWTGFFEYFSNVECIDGLELIDTSNVYIMKDVFRNCIKLDTFDISDLSIDNVTTIEGMFDGCKEFRGFTRAVPTFTHLQNASKAFRGCKSLRTINFTPYLSNDLSNTSSMFENCTSLSSIMVDNNVMILPHAESMFDVQGNNDMFKNCTNLKGGQGTKYEARSKIPEKDLACVDYGGIKPGFFSFYDSSKYGEVTFTLPNNWLAFASYIPGFTKDSFRGIKFYKDIKGIYNNLRTIYISDTDHTRFYIDADDNIIIHCGKFTPKIKFPANSSGLFKDFTNVIKIEGLDKVDISDVTNMSEMFSGCANLQELNLLSFATNAVTDVSSMFKNDGAITTIKASSSFAIRGVTGDDMFLNCDSLEGGEGTEYSVAGVNDSTYAFPDEGPTSANPGYFTWDDEVVFVYNLIYDGNGADGGEAMPKKEGCREAVGVTLDANTYTKTHHRFLGWSDLSTATSEDWKTSDYWYDQDTFVYEPEHQFEDKIIYAVWEKIDYTVVYNGNGASGGNVPTNQTGYSGDDLTLRTNSGNLWKTGKYLVGWDENQSANNPTYPLGGKMNKTFASSGTVTLYAIWGSVPYTIRLNPNGATGDVIEIAAQSDIAVKIPNVSWERTSYSLLAWNTDKNATAQNCGIVGENYSAYGGIVNRTLGANQANSIYNLYAVWEENSTPSPSPSGSGGSSGGGGGGGGPRLDVNRPNTTILPIVKVNSLMVIDSIKASWRFDPNSNSFKLNIDVNGEKLPAANVFVAINSTETQNEIPGGNHNLVVYTYCFDQNSNMLTGWVGTADNKWYFFENEKTVLEGSMIIGWKKIQDAWYYFTADGEMLTNAMTPDGYMVDAQGKWTQNI